MKMEPTNCYVNLNFCFLVAIVATLILLTDTVGLVEMQSNCYGLNDRMKWHLSLHKLAPTQVHISYSNYSSEMNIIWTHRNQPQKQFVVYSLDSQENNTCLKTDGEIFQLPMHVATLLANQYYCKSTMKDLLPGQLYKYQVVAVSADNNYYTSPVYNFRSLDTSTESIPTFIVFGDMGRDAGEPVLNNLKKRAKEYKYSAILHVGDFAYDFASKSGQRGDKFMNRIEPIAARVPYMTCPGNHEIERESFTFYRYKFCMPGCNYPMRKDHLFYSFNIGNVHLISYSSEVYYVFKDVMPSPVELQYNWLKSDLENANKERDTRPWIIAFGHRPMYCSNMNKDDCTKPTAKVRDGLEELFYSMGVDVIIEAHEHSYERLWPVYNSTVTSRDYNNPQAPVHIISGAPGCNQYNGLCLDPFLDKPGPWSAYRSWFPGLYGFGELTSVNNSHLHWRQILSVNEQTEDEIYIIQENHGPFPHT